MSRAALREIIPAPNYQTRLITKNQSAKDIAALLLVAERNSRVYVKKLLPFFDAKTEKEVAYKVWYFLRNNINYVKEPPSRQSAKTINRIISDGFGDCKHYSIFAVCILRAFGMDANFRLAGFTYDDKSPTHAYAVVFVGDRKIIIDPCIKRFNEECSYKHVYNIKPLQ